MRVSATVRVEVRLTGGTLTVQVADDGPGVGATTRRSGLGNLAGRAHRRGGTFSTDPLSGPGSGATGPGGTGTTVRWSVPLPKEG